MNRKTLIASLVAAAVVPVAVAQDTLYQRQVDRGGPEQAMPAMPPEFIERMQAGMAAGTPGEMHEQLAKSAGRWDARVTMWMMPDMPPMESTGTAVITPMFGNRYLKHEFNGDMGQMGVYEGFGLYGYDNSSETFQAVWIDSMSTGMKLATGELSDDGKVLTWRFEYTCPATEQLTWFREVTRYVDDDTMVMEMYGPDLDGNEYKMMEIRYTRQTDEAAPEAPVSE